MKACNQCGKCCIKYSDGDITASEQDLESWQFFSPHIAEYVKGGLIWFSPDTGKRLALCPFLSKTTDTTTGRALYSCDIYFDRPEDCRLYPTSLQQMYRDECEMLEASDTGNPQLALESLAKLATE